MQQTQTDTDVLIIGGGPAGSTAATYLARAGHRVTVLERAKFPREHVGESLLPYCYPIFQELGVLDEMKQRFVRKPGVRFIDTDGETYTTWCFSHVLKDDSQLSFHVIRGEFDKMLLDHSAKNGAVVHEETKVEDVNPDGPDGTVIVTAMTASGEKKTFTARYLLDASGRDTFMANRMHVKKAHKHLDRTAISGHWQGAKYEGGIDEGLLQIVYLGGDKQGWIWVIPVGTDRVSIGVVMNHSYIGGQKAKFSEAGSDNWKLDLYQQELQGSPFVAGILKDAKRCTPLMFNGDYSYFVERKFGDNYAMVGDAATFIDPIFASGIYLCMNSARLVSRAISTQLNEGKEAGSKAIAAAYETIHGAYTLVDKAIRMFYNPNAINFAQMGHTNAHMAHVENVMAIGHYLLAGDFFENHQKYFDFLEHFQDEDFARRYRKYVVDRPEYKSTTCNVDKKLVFDEMMKVHEERRAKELEILSQKVGMTMTIALTET